MVLADVEQHGLHALLGDDLAMNDGQLQAVAVELERAGLEMIDTQPRAGIRGSRVAFMHPRGTDSVLTEIVQPAGEHHGAGMASAGAGAS